MRVLVVEDDPDLNRQLASALVDAGYAVDSAHDGEEGYFLGETEPYDIVILDIGLPKKDGISVLEQWRRAERNRTGDRFTFSIQRAVVDEVNFSGDREEPFTVRLAQALPNREHSLTLIPVQAGQAAHITKLTAFRPPYQAP